MNKKKNELKKNIKFFKNEKKNLIRNWLFKKDRVLTKNCVMPTILFS